MGTGNRVVIHLSPCSRPPDNYALDKGKSGRRGPNQNNKRHNATSKQLKLPGLSFPASTQN